MHVCGDESNYQTYLSSLSFSIIYREHTYAKAYLNNANSYKKRLKFLNYILYIDEFTYADFFSLEISSNPASINK